MTPHENLTTTRATAVSSGAEASPASTKSNGKSNGSSWNGLTPAKEEATRRTLIRTNAEISTEAAVSGDSLTKKVEAAATDEFYESPFLKVDISDVLTAIAPQMEAVEEEIERLITSSVKAVADVASHTLGAGGKRLRPAMTILAAQLCGDGSEFVNSKVISCAAAIELTHTTTLLHDDVVDSAEVRRGKPAANLIWGNGMSVLVGDYLFAQVFLIASQKGFVELMHPLAEATSKMCAGELLEVQQQGRLDINEAQYEEVIALKTAALTECAARIGALAVDASEEQVARMARYGYHIGLGFQIVDDVFDLVSTRARIGKPVGNDIREGTVTLPMLRTLQLAAPEEAAELRGLIGKSPIEDKDVARALQLIRASDSIDYAMQIAAQHIATARAQLEFFDQSPARVGLENIADYVLSRDK